MEKKGFEIEIDAIIGLAKANAEISTYLIDSVLKEFRKDINEIVFESGDLDDEYRDCGWRQPL